jgi:hypothetical protein
MKLQEFYVICDSLEPDDRGCCCLPGRSLEHYWGVSIDGGKHRANRLILERKLGRPIKDGMYACHKCDVKACVAPEHIYEGTPKENVDDMWGVSHKIRKEDRTPSKRIIITRIPHWARMKNKARG